MRTSDVKNIHLIFWFLDLDGIEMSMQTKIKIKTQFFEYKYDYSYDYHIYYRVYFEHLQSFNR